jgi:hypothetical protein
MKKLISKALIIMLLITGIFTLSGCNSKKEKGVEISYVNGKGTFTLTVPKKEDGTAKYEFTTEKPKGSMKTGTFYLETDSAILAFSTSGLVYNTSKDYKAKYGDTKATFAGYLEFMDDESISSRPRLAGIEKFEINGAQAIRYYSRTGGSGDYVYYGYNYAIAVDEIYPGSKAEIGVYYKTDEKLSEAKEFDQETLDIINSLKITLNK